MKDSEKKFLEDNFKAGEYMTLTIMVKNTESSRLIEHLKKSNLNLAILPNVKAAADFNNPGYKGTIQ